ncbi:unnamed protein product [Didymodactylos carnosus]|uniref:Uncharacterized protein n=1 Tax=Didymodactylos carnosus TaxID=1234261 RepID=A0A8S2MZL3_9BILA|nr:unnamed protein product [Didymodactylos carnosus]CAF3968691.1 unnamed protein product [Didymodactylos carnosus]
MADWIPGISQVKSLFQVACGDLKGAAKTQDNFIKQCPGVSQVTSVVQLVTGDADGALETQKQCLGTLSRVADGVPVVGHAKGLIHYAAGDTQGGHRAMRSSTRTCAVMGAGAAGFVAGGPVGAVGLGVAAGAGMDSIYTVATDTPQGYVAAVKNVVENPSAGGLFDMALMPVGDGMTGMAGGAIARSVQNNVQLQQAAELYNRADATLQAAEANVQSMTSGEYMQQMNTAADLFKTAQNIEQAVNGPPPPSTFSAAGKSGESAAVTTAGQTATPTVTIVVPESGLLETEQSTRRVYVKRHRRNDGVYEIEIAGEAEASATVTFLNVENAPTAMRNVHANLAMGKLDNSVRGFDHILVRHRNDFQQLGLSVNGVDRWNDQITLITYLRNTMRASNFIGQEFSHSGSLRFAWRVKDILGRERILVVGYSSQTYEITDNSEIRGPFREIMSAFLLEPNEKGVFTRPSNFVDSCGRSKSA